MSDKYYTIARNCLSNANSEGKNFYSYFKDGEESFREEVPQSIFQWSGQMGVHGTPAAPLFVHKATSDEIRVAADIDSLLKTLPFQGG